MAGALLLIVGGVLAVRSERLARYDAQTVWNNVSTAEGSGAAKTD